MSATIEAIFIASEGGVTMQSVSEIEALADLGLRGDRYYARRGHWSYSDECQVTLIEGESLDEIYRTTGISVSNGVHRRNVITRGLRLEKLSGKQFRVGEALLAYDRPRPPCAYVQSLTEAGMTRALMGRAGICARVVQSGWIRVKDPIQVAPRT